MFLKCIENSLIISLETNVKFQQFIVSFLETKKNIALKIEWIEVKALAGIAYILNINLFVR